MGLRQPVTHGSSLFHPSHRSNPGTLVSSRRARSGLTRPDPGHGPGPGIDASDRAVFGTVFGWHPAPASATGLIGPARPFRTR